MARMFQVYGVGHALIPVLPPPLPFENPPTSNQTNYEIGQVVYTPPHNPTDFFIYAGGGNWSLFTSGSGDIVAVNGTANQITVNTVAGVATVSLPASIITPGSLTVNGAFTQSGGTASINGTGTGTTVIGSATASNINISSNQNISVGTIGGFVSIQTEGQPIGIGDNAADMTVNLGTGDNGGVKFVNIGSSVGTSVTTIHAGLGNLSINPDSGAQTSIGSNVGGPVIIEADSTITVASFGGDIELTCSGVGDVQVIDANLTLIRNGRYLAVTGGVATDFIGTVTLVAGVGAVANTNIAANDRIFVQRISSNASTQVGVFEYTITAGTNFNIISVAPGTPGVPLAADVSTVTYFIVRQLA